MPDFPDTIAGLIDRIIIDQDRMREITLSVASRIKSEYAPCDNVTILSVLDGAAYFTDALFKTSLLDNSKFSKLGIRANSYGNNFSPSAQVCLDLKNAQGKLAGRNVLIIDDIYDSGQTLSAVLASIKSAGPSSIRTCVMIARLRKRDQELKLDFVGEHVSDPGFLVGCGLDFKGKYRDLPYVAAIKRT
jgi:hypoxanthine phosphoribosyltransferase